jgi:hypothetical protein
MPLERTARSDRTDIVNSHGKNRKPLSLIVTSRPAALGQQHGFLPQTGVL